MKFKTILKNITSPLVLKYHNSIGDSQSGISIDRNTSRYTIEKFITFSIEYNTLDKPTETIWHQRCPSSEAKQAQLRFCI